MTQTLEFQPGGYAMVVFGCGRSYIGAEEEVGPAIKRHQESGCKKCRRYQKRMERLYPWLQSPPEASA